MHSTDTDTTPWYKQFWPWFFITLLSSAIIGSLTTLTIAIKNPDPVVNKQDNALSKNNVYQQGK